LVFAKQLWRCMAFSQPGGRFGSRYRSHQARGREAALSQFLVASIARGRRWLDELTTDPTANVECIAKRSERAVALGRST
jgi:hypothetical protein